MMKISDKYYIKNKIVKKYLAYLIDIIKIKKSLVVKTQDLRIYLGVNSNGELANFGRLLSKIEKIGLAKRINRNRRIKKYRLNHIFVTMAERCNGFRCISCSFYLCPYRRLASSF